MTKLISKTTTSKFVAAKGAAPKAAAKAETKAPAKATGKTAKAPAKDETRSSNIPADAVRFSTGTGEKKIEYVIFASVWQEQNQIRVARVYNRNGIEFMGSQGINIGAEVYKIFLSRLVKASADFIG